MDTTHRYEPFLLDSVQQVEAVLAVPRETLTYEQWWEMSNPYPQVLPPNLDVVQWAIKFAKSGPDAKPDYAHREKQAFELVSAAPSWERFFNLLPRFKNLLDWVNKHLEDEREEFHEKRRSPPPGL